MKFVDIEVFNTARTTVDRDEVRRWLDWLGANEFEIPPEETISDPALLIALAAKRCYLSFQASLNPNLTKVRSDLVEYLDNILKSGHGSVLEHAVYTFNIEGVSRVFTGEMNRHRAGVGISEGSMRYIRFNDIPAWCPKSISLTKGELENIDHVTGLPADKLAAKKLKTQKVFDRHFKMTELNYAEIAEIWAEELSPTSKFHAKKQITSMMRRIVPMGVATGGTWTFNLRAMRHIIALRASEAAEEEIAYVFGKIGKVMHEKEPAIFGDFTQDDAGFWVPKYPKV